MELYQLPPGKHVNEIVNEYVVEYNSLNKVLCNSTHNNCIKLKKFLKYIFDNHNHENYLHIWNIKNLGIKLLTCFNDKLCFSLRKSIIGNPLKQL
jgi:hypothetical protein